jgi:hypothetical protein
MPFVFLRMGITDGQDEINDIHLYWICYVQVMGMGSNNSLFRFLVME